jgi:hypothetical protein
MTMIPEAKDTGSLSLAQASFGLGVGVGVAGKPVFVWQILKDAPLSDTWDEEVVGQRRWKILGAPLGFLGSLPILQMSN